MGRVRADIHNYKRIIYIDFSNLNTSSTAEIAKVIDEAKQTIKINPLNSVLTLTNVTGVFFNKEILEMMMQYLAENKPYIKASAIIGAEGLRKIAVNSAERFSMRDLHLFDSEIEAKNWLAEQ